MSNRTMQGGVDVLIRAAYINFYHSNGDMVKNNFSEAQDLSKDDLHMPLVKIRMDHFDVDQLILEDNYQEAVEAAEIVFADLDRMRWKRIAIELRTDVGPLMNQSADAGMRAMGLEMLEKPGGV